MSAAALLTLALAACGHDDPAPAPTTPPPSLVPDAPDARADLAGLATLAQDHAYAALYSLDDGDGLARNVVATSAADGTWRVDVSGGALGGSADVSIVSTRAGVYQCTMSSPQQPITPTCVRVANPGKKVPAEYDPQVERLFRPALTVFTDRQAPLSVGAVQPLSGAKGSCFSVDTIAAALSAPVDVGIYCYQPDGLLTAARVGFGTLTLVSTGAGPATVALPGPEVPGQPMSTESPSLPPAIQVPSGQPSVPPAQ
ncbi:hypothetical protein [Actinoplanes sp. NPDC051411]|uniref:hypothetical protein n=1 Tax=Actinoplanes sp. NPDC051411 TaxID=3155522 RepID=UPI003416C4BB